MPLASRKNRLTRSLIGIFSVSAFGASSLFLATTVFASAAVGSTPTSGLHTTAAKIPAFTNAQSVEQYTTQGPDANGNAGQALAVSPGRIKPAISGTDPDLPSAVREGGSVGSVTDPNSGSDPGAFSYQFPFDLPQGRNGTTPDLTLSYSSNSHDDSGFGYGWQLSIPYIERFNKLGFGNIYSTSTPSTAFYSSLTGELATTSNSSQYLTRNDDGSDFQYTFANNSWTAFDKAGNTYIFGLATSTRQDDSLGSGEVFKWMLQQVTDANGNTTTYTYTKDRGQIYPASIAYTSNGATPGIFGVNFTLGARATTTATSTAIGFPVNTRYQVTQVTTLINSATTSTYSLSYNPGDNGVRPLLSSITKTGINGLSTLALPSTLFSYSSSTPAMATSTWGVPGGYFVYTDEDRGISTTDINGDGLTDIVQAFQTGGVTTKNVYVDNGTSGWTTATGWTIPCLFTEYNSGVVDDGGRLADVNGDGLPDFICGTSTYINTGSNWVASSTWALPTTTATGGYDQGVRFADVNGDGLLDIVQSMDENVGFTEVYTQKVWLNNGHGWTYDPTWVVPSQVIFTTDFGEDGGSRLQDINGDGLADIIVGEPEGGYSTGNVLINNGHGWTYDPAWNMPSDIAPDSSAVSIYDANGDGLPDINFALGNFTDFSDPSTFYWINNETYLNTGMGWVRDYTRTIPLAFYADGETGARVGNISGGGLSDLIVSGLVGHIGYGGLQFAQGSPADLLTAVTESTGKKETVTYKETSSYKDGSGNLLNPNLASYFPTAQSVQTFDGVNSTSTTSYVYQNGCYYFATPTDRRFAGFGVITTIDPLGNISDSYYHTGNGASTTIGEYSDNQSKIGKEYRVENYDSSNNLFKVVINKWDSLVRAGAAAFTFLDRATELDYDGRASHNDIASEFTYSTTTDAVTQQISWGQVLGNNDGTFTDTGSDKRTTNLSYAASSTAPLFQVSEKITTNQSGTTLGDIRNYYDTLSLGSITKGNLTEVDSLKTGTSTYIQSDRKAYNGYGLVTQDTDPLGNITSYSYDSYNLYPATTTNPLSQSTTYLYNYFTGKPTQIKDPNGSVTQTNYDPLNRILSILKPNPLSPSSLATTTAYVYTDSTYPRLTQETDYLSSSLATNKYIYQDGYGKTIEERDQAENTNTYAVKDKYYNGLGLIATDALPYFGSGTSYTGVSAPPTSYLDTTYSYDPLQRTTNTTNSVGSTLNSYGNWEVTTTDPDGNKKDYYKDAYGNLINVVEYVGGTPATTTYAYDGNNNLTKLTDSLGNIRDFTYDLLGRKLTSEDLHAATSTSFGTWQYVYDNSGNLTQQTDPKSQVTNYTYDAINRPLTEDYTGQAGTELTYVYDTCTNGIGHLCSATATSSVTSYTYDLLGNTANESELIGTTTYTTQRAYDRLGNITNIIYPDNSQVSYVYNVAGLLDSVGQKENGAPSFSGVVTNFDYNPNDQVVAKDFANGVTTTYTYDQTKLYHLTRIHTVASGGIGTLVRIGGGGLSLGGASTSSDIFSQLNKDAPLGTYLDDAFTMPVEDITDSSTPAILPEQVATTTEDSTSSSDISAEGTSTPDSIPVITMATTTDSTASSSIPVTQDDTTSTTTPEIASTTSPVASTTTPVVIDGTDTTATTIATTTDDLSPDATSTDMEATSTESLADYLKSLPVDSDELKLKAPVSSILGSLPLPDGTVKYAYKTDVSVDSVPVSVTTLAEANKQNLTVGQEMVDKRTSHARIYATNKTGVYVADISSGDPKYYEDSDGKWWIAEYGLTTQESYDYQTKPKDLSLIDKIIDFFLPQPAYASSSTFYPEASPGATSVDGATLKNNSNNWFTTRTAASATTVEDTDSTIQVLDEPGTNFQLGRGYLLFDTSSLSTADSITSASIGLYVTVVSPLANNKIVYISSSTPASNTSLAVGDYSQVGSTSFGSSSGSPTINAYNMISLNSSGVATVSTSSVSAFSVRTYDDFNNIAPAGSNQLLVFKFASSEGGSSVAPELVVTYTSVPTGPTSLQADGQTDPVNLASHTPGLSAIFNDSDAGDYATDYEIQVATSSSFSGSPIWDSGEHPVTASTTNGTYSPAVTYSGTGLPAYTTYYWRIKFWDSIGGAGAWSTETATFSVAPWYTPTAPTDLEVNGTANPTNLASSTPAFSSIFREEVATDTASSYQIQVSTASSSWSSLYWDSGKTSLGTSTPEGSRSPGITYAGTTLVPGSTYYWRMKFWNSTDAVGDWSTTTASFTLSSSLSAGDLQDIYYTYDANGNITQINDYSGSGAAKTELFSYDGLNRLITASTTVASSSPFSQSYSYGLTGDILDKSDVGSYGYSGAGNADPDAPTTIGTTSLAYDADGNLTGYGSSGYQWDYRNRLAATGNGIATSTYSYDYQSNRIEKIFAGLTTIYPNTLYNITGATSTRSIFDNQGGLLATMLVNGSSTATTYIHPDNLGSTNVTTNATGHLASTLDYYPFGSSRVNTGSPAEQRTYIGQQYDAESALSYLNARYYDGTRGQFLSIDPVFLGSPLSQVINDPQSLNAYAYSENNPITKKDPTGKYGEISYTGVYGVKTFTAGIRFDSNGIDIFGGGGPAKGEEEGIEAAWAPNQELSHVSGSTIEASGEAADGLGLKVTQNLASDPAATKNSGTSKPVIAVVFGGGVGAGVSQEFTAPLLTWGSDDSMPLGSTASIPTTISLPSKNLAPAGKYGGLLGGVANSLIKTK